MNRLRKVIGNAIISLLGQAVTWTSTMVLTISYGRFLGDEKFGELYFAITFVGLIGFPIDAGFNDQLMRDVAQEPSKALRYTTNILCFKIILWIILYGLILLLSLLLGYNDETRIVVAICGISLLTSSITSLMSGLHYSFERVIFPVVGNILEKVLNGLIGGILLANGANVETMALVLLGGSCVSMIWQTAAVLRLVGIPITFDVPLARNLLKGSIPFILYGALAVIYYRIDTVLLSFMMSNTVVGWYGAAYRLFDTMVFLPSLVINAIMYPVFSKLSVHSGNELKVAIEKSLNFLIFCCIPITTGLIIAAPSVIGFLFPRSDFTNAIPALQGLAPGLLFLYINSVLNSVILSTGLEKKIPIMAVVALVFNLGLNLLLIPLYQHVGAAAVTSLTELLLTFLSLIFVPRVLWPTGSVKVGLKALVAGLVMGAVVWFLQNREYTLPAIIPAAAIVYFGTATLLGTIPRDDMNAFFAAIRRKTGGNKGEVGEDLLTEEEMQQSQELQRVLGHEMTSPLLPAFGFELANATLPEFRFEMTQLLPIYKRETTLPNRPRPSKVDIENEDTYPLNAVVPIESQKTWDLPKIDDEEATLLLNKVHPTRDKKSNRHF